ncbi:hypothetical protein E2C01_020107 [Portunus trituberculatus]|uniref:Casein kinase 1 gamma C-terminal domain-containing protein n=1 Tax=Portunus trituberculatus TaxID=210409 RepID=A0A5B7E0F1_PORTR|nr:hypothetical protein [Portunus trituberculatus]
MELLLVEVVVMVVCRCGSHVAMGPTLQGGTKGTAAWPETPKQASNMLGGNLTPADRHGSVQVIPLPRASLPTLYSCCLLPPTLAAGGKAYLQGQVFLIVLRKFFPFEHSQFPDVAVSSKERRRRQGVASDWQWCSAPRREKPLRCCCQPHSRSPMRASSTLRHRHQGAGNKPTPTSTDHSTITSSPPEALHLQCSQVLASQDVEWSLMLTSVLCKNLL